MCCEPYLQKGGGKEKKRDELRKDRKKKKKKKKKLSSSTRVSSRNVDFGWWTGLPLPINLSVATEHKTRGNDDGEEVMNF